MAFLPRRLGLAAAAGGAVLIGFALGWWGDQPPARRDIVPGANSDWVLPKSSAADLAGFAKILAQRLPFGAPAERANPGSAAPQQAAAATAGAAQWRVGGIVVTETGRHLVILIRRPNDNATRSEIRRPGEELPDGSIVRAVEPSNVTVEREGKIVRIKMFAQN
jgi:hypothetical protein